MNIFSPGGPSSSSSSSSSLSHIPPDHFICYLPVGREGHNSSSVALSFSLSLSYIPDPLLRRFTCHCTPPSISRNSSATTTRHIHHIVFTTTIYVLPSSNPLIPNGFCYNADDDYDDEDEDDDNDNWQRIKDTTTMNWRNILSNKFYCDALIVASML